jgi:dihydropteroate synthase
MHPQAPRRWRLAHDRAIPLDRPRLMAIVNVTPDSFYAGSRACAVGPALAVARRAVDEGADLLDIGGESTRPGSDRVGEPEQLARVLPLVEAIRRADGPLARIPISIDTTLPGVAEAALGAGADALNDVSGATEHPEILGVAAAHGAGLVLMHRARPPAADSFSDEYAGDPPRYDEVVSEVAAFLRARAEAALGAGVAPASIVLDPGLGFGKTVDQNLQLLRRSAELASLGYPVLSAASRKSFVGRAGCPESPRTDPADRLPASLAFSVLHLGAGARIFRVHDVAPQRQALLAAWAILGEPD